MSSIIVYWHDRFIPWWSGESTEIPAAIGGGGGKVTKPPAVWHEGPMSIDSTPCDLHDRGRPKVAPTSTWRFLSPGSSLRADYASNSWPVQSSLNGMLDCGEWNQVATTTWAQVAVMLRTKIIIVYTAVRLTICFFVSWCFANGLINETCTLPMFFLSHS